MNHDEIENEQLIDLYLMRRLDGRRQEDFEEHLLECAQCVEELELRQAFIGGLQQMHRRDFGIKRDFSNWRTCALAASILLAITGPLSIWSLHELSQVRRGQSGELVTDMPFVVMPLVLTRGDSGEAANVVDVGSSPKWLVFELEGDYTPGMAYTVRIIGSEAKSVLETRMVPDSRGVGVVGLNSTMLAAGNYTLDVAAPEQRDGNSRFALEVVR